ncbi:hypothetical protein Y032_0797g2404 [Ancylostoma ceylanicum]|nr:hypothetical protein Y032_0797g2404 [Ancylostoma ceylanicum]
MKRFIAYYDSHLFDLNRLDNFYRNIAQIDDFEKLSFLELVDKFDRMDTEERLKNLGQPKKSDELEIKGAFKLNELVTALNWPYYNKIDIRIGLLQFPYFGLTLPKSFNYGAIGTVIGHEVTHGFDNKGKNYDENGSMEEWLGREFQERFRTRADCFEKLYNTTDVLWYKNGMVLKTNLTNNGAFTLHENIADYGGIQLSLRVNVCLLKKQSSRPVAIAPLATMAVPRYSLSHLDSR